MLTPKELNDLLPILNVQYSLVNKLTQKVEDIEVAFSTNGETAIDIVSVQKELDAVLQDIDWLSEDDIVVAERETECIDAIYKQKQAQIKSHIKKIKFNTWDDYVAECYKYAIKNDIGKFIPYEMFLTKADLAMINNEAYSKQFEWDKWDYSFVGLAGIVAALTDIFIVAIPKDMTSGIYKGQKGSSVTKWLQSLRLPDNVQEWLENVAKVPYDNTGGPEHRMDTFGHDPILGFIFGIIDLVRGTSTSIKDGTIIIEKIGEGTNLLEAIVKQFLHLCSDVCTKRGLPVPFASIFKLLNVGSFKRANGKTATISQLTKWMYRNGYDLRHFITMSITPMSIEIILRMYTMLRYYAENDDIDFDIATVFELGNNPKYRSMLLSAHAIACAANAGKVYLRQGNPLAINYAEWLMLLKYLVPSVKYWLFDKAELEVKHLKSINDNIWNELLENSDSLLRKSKFENIELVTLGASEPQSII
ncbi:hypothetical protein [Pectinatus brassicae]|uniref:Uncharacterized protein n=1 Tax=Pectinatus brassicae TaxID=862415 RepID=A0A840UHD7_9FIRM|nr:hypothetical protein [Pectinatus brassicae]MBB5336419.1 hypothetical protein [Pectinatus brassicae]